MTVSKHRAKKWLVDAQVRVHLVTTLTLFGFVTLSPLLPDRAIKEILRYIKSFSSFPELSARFPVRDSTIY
jgi:hypothetical protein